MRTTTLIENPCLGCEYFRWSVDIIYAPHSEQARLAMFAVLDEIARHGWAVTIDSFHGSDDPFAWTVAVDDEDGDQIYSGVGDSLPAAVALAALGAHHAQKGE